MRVTFVKKERHYGVYVSRDRASDLFIGSAPGYDDWLPHDLLHFVAEAELGLDGGVFGDVAAGGNAKIFQPVDKTLVAKMWRRKRMRRYVLPEGKRSERLADLLATAWRAHRGGSPLPADWSERLAAGGVEDAAVQALVPRLDELAATWRELPPGGELTLPWPRPEGRRRHPPRDRRRPAATRR
jgi:hypothetical protein